MFEVKLIMPWMDKGDKKNRIYTEVVDEAESTPGMSSQLTRFSSECQRDLEEILVLLYDTDQNYSTEFAKHRIDECLKMHGFRLSGFHCPNQVNKEKLVVEPKMEIESLEDYR